MEKVIAIKKDMNRGNGCLGPVSNLEDFVKSDWWNSIFNSYYLKTDGDVVEDNSITSTEIDLFSEILNLERNQSILDLCCGQGRHTIELAKRDFRKVEGLDRSRYLINKARTHAKTLGLSCRFREGDARKLPFQPDQFDAILILGNSFGYFETMQDDLLVLKNVFRTLKPWGNLLIDLADGDYLRKNFTTRSWEWIDKNYFVCRERALSLDKQKLVSREIITHVNKGVLIDQFYAERLYSKKTISNLLRQAGFTNIEFHGTITPESQRDQDLGMMEKRLIITAIAKKEWTEVKKKEKVQRIVGVIFGDPNKPDLLKPSYAFDDDDYYTIDRLKNALNEINDYKFIYFNNHDTLIQDLTKFKSKFDYIFNLCDEGYYNDAKKELHIPALLELLRISYTGSGPQSLAFCYDKSLVKGLAKELDIPVAEGILVKPDEKIIDLPLYFPAIVKPNYGDSSFGISQNCVVNNGEELLNAINEIRDKFGYDKSIIIEQYLTGKDLTVGLIGNSSEDYFFLPIHEEDYSELPPDYPKICGYEAKWLPDSPYWKLRSKVAELSPETVEVIESSCLKLAERLQCKDYTRFDWRLDSNGLPRLLEVNPNPGWCWDGHLAKMAANAGLSYKDMLNKILETAEKRIFS